MRENRRKLIVSTLVATMALTGVLLATGCSAEVDAADSGEALVAGSVETADIGQQAMETTFAQAWAEVEGDEKGGRCRTLVDKGLITHDQVDEFKEWLDSQRGLENCDGDCDDCEQDHEDHGADLKDCDGDCDNCEQTV